jgi:hypothetical protein
MNTRLWQLLESSSKRVLLSLADLESFAADVSASSTASTASAISGSKTDLRSPTDLGTRCL